jgi:hypothetical protein
MLVVVSVSLTKAAQETDVGEGLALGLVVLGVDSFAGSKMSVEFAFQRAWRDWPYRGRFPAVHADVARNDLLRIISKSEGRRSAHLSGWASEWPFVPYLREDWALEEVGELLESSSGVPLGAWVELARAFIDDLRDKQAGHQ